MMMFMKKRRGALTLWYILGWYIAVSLVLNILDPNIASDYSEQFVTVHKNLNGSESVTLNEEYRSNIESDTKNPSIWNSIGSFVSGVSKVITGIFSWVSKPFSMFSEIEGIPSDAKRIIMTLGAIALGLALYTAAKSGT